MGDVREKRTQVVSESDWMANSDVTMTDGGKAF